MADIQGTIVGETLDGTADADNINAGGGDDTVNGLGGDDTLNGGADHDTLRGSGGDDTLNGDAGDDFLVGGSGNDVMNGGAGADRISLFDDGTGGFGITVDLRLDGVVQNFGPLGNDTLSGIEHVNTTYNDDLVNGNDERNWIWTYSGFDTLFGHGGDDYFTVGQGTKVIDGGSGSDTVEIDDQAWVPAYGAGGITVSLVLQGAAQATGVGNWTLTSIENLSGNFGSDNFTGDGNDNTLAGAGGNDVLTGGGGNDTLLGDGAMFYGYDPANPGAYQFQADMSALGVVAGNDTLNGGDDNDTLDGGAGLDKLFGDNGDDTLILRDAVVSGEIYNGGAGTDTLEVRGGILNQFGPLGNSTSYSLTPATLSGIERILFASTAGSGVSVTLLANQVSGAGITGLVGGAGNDALVVVAATPPAGGVFTMPSFTLTNWNSSATPFKAAGDVLVLSVGAPGNYTLNAREGLASVQALVGGVGNDTLNGSSGVDTLNGAGGTNVLHGNGGDDVLVLLNNINPQGVLTTFTGFGSTFDGGSDTDVLSIGGEVHLEATLTSIEGVYLQPAFTSTAPNGSGSQVAAVLEMDLVHFAMLPANVFFDGTGTVDVDLQQGDSFDFSGIVFKPGSSILFTFEGESEGAGTAVTWIGTSNGDYFEFGSDITAVTGGGGADIFEIEGGDDRATHVTILDFTPGVDKLDLSGSGITGGQRLADFVSQVGADVVIALASGTSSVEYVLKDTLLGDLSEDDVLFGDWTGPEVETGTEFTDLLFGFAGNDQLHGAGGNDRLYGGGGTDQLFGDAGNDTLILDELVTSGIFNGGADTDTLELRTAAYNQVTAFGPNSSYLLTQATLTGIEQVRFASDSDAGVGLTLLLGQVASSGLTTLIGGAGRDSLVAVAFSPTGGTFAMPNLTLVNWNSSATPYSAGGDALVLTANGAGNFTLNAREGLASVQALVGAAGNDTLNGSSGVDVLNGAGGTNVLQGNAGNDVLVLLNNINPQGLLTTFNGFGSTFDGGSGTDVLSIGGVVDFQGALSGIEQIYLQAAFASSAPLGAGSQSAAALGLDGELLASLPVDLVLSGSGTITIDLDPGDVYDASGWTMAPGSTVAVSVTGSSEADTITLGSFAETVDDGGGIDTAVFSGNSGDYLAAAGPAGSVTIGADTLSGIELFQFADGTFFWNGVNLVSAVSEGLVADGYVAGATVYIDGNNNGTLDAGEAFTITDALGDFTLISPSTGPLRAFGGTNVDTGLPNTVQLSAPDGASVINPLTTLVQTLVETGGAADEAAAQAAVKGAFGIDPSIDLANLDLIAAATSDPALALTAHKAAASVAEVLSIVNNAGGDGGAALLELTSVVASGNPVDLTDTATLTQVVQSGVAGGAPVSAAEIVAVVQIGTAAISTSTSVSEVSAAQGNALPIATGETGAVAEDGTLAAATRAAGVLANDVDPDTGETALLRVTKVQGAAPAATTIATVGTTTVQGAYGTLLIGSDGTYSYTANSAAAQGLAGGQAASDAFTYTVGDPKAQEATATLTFNITGVDDAAVAVDDVNAVLENGTIVGASVFGNDSDVDGPALAIAEINGSVTNVGTEIVLASGAKLVVAADGTYSYDPNGRFDTLTAIAGASNSSATDSFTYTLAGGNTATVTVTINGVTGPGDLLLGNTLPDTINGTASADSFDLSQGGDDTASGGDGNDAFFFGAAFTGADTVDGGAGSNDQIGLQGNYTGGNSLVLGAGTITGVEVIAALPGFDYSITTVDANVPSGGTLKVFAGNLGVGDDFTFKGGAELDGSFMVYAGLGTDLITTGAGNDGIYFGPGKFDPLVDRVDGGTGSNDQLALDGDYTLTLDGAAIHNIDAVVLLPGVTGDLADYSLTLAASLVGAGQALTIWGTPLQTGYLLNGTAVAGDLTIYGGTQGDLLIGGSGNDWLWGGLGGDRLGGGAGSDTFLYQDASESTGADYDRIDAFDQAVDRIDLPFAVSGFAGPFTGDLDGATFGTQLESAFAGLASHQAGLATATGGDIAGHVFLVVDANGVAGYQHGADYLFEMTNPASPIDNTAMFV